MDNFTFRTRRSFDSKYEFHRLLEVIKRIKLRCPDYSIQESLGGHPANAFDGMTLPINSDEEYIYDDFMLFFDSANNLVQLNESLSGKNAWDKVADVIDTRSGIGINDWHWTLNTYKLKSEYSQLLIENLNILEKEICTNYESFLSEERKKEDERETLRNSITSIDTSGRLITDEGGKTKVYTHSITFLDGETLTFTERNVFDFGIVINPSYSVSPAAEHGVLCLKHDDCYQWHEFISNNGWVPVRTLTKNESTAMEYLHVFGGFSGHGVRM